MAEHNPNFSAPVAIAGAAQNHNRHVAHISSTLSSQALSPQRQPVADSLERAPWIDEFERVVLNTQTIPVILATLRHPQIQQDLHGHIDGILAIINRLFADPQSVTRPRVNGLVLDFGRVPGVQVVSHALVTSQLDLEARFSQVQKSLWHDIIGFKPTKGFPEREAASVGRAPDGTIFICFLCRNRKQRFSKTSDLERHLRNDHHYEPEDVVSVFKHESLWQRFGPYRDSVPFFRAYGWQVRPANTRSSTPKQTRTAKQRFDKGSQGTQNQSALPKGKDNRPAKEANTQANAATRQHTEGVITSWREPIPAALPRCSTVIQQSTCPDLISDLPTTAMNGAEEPDLLSIASLEQRPSLENTISATGAVPHQIAHDLSTLSMAHDHSLLAGIGTANPELLSKAREKEEDDDDDDDDDNDAVEEFLRAVMAFDSETDDTSMTNSNF